VFNWLPTSKLSRRLYRGLRLWCAPAPNSQPAAVFHSQSSIRSLPFKVAPIGQFARHVKDYTHFIIDTEANPSDEDFKEAAEGCDLLVIPAEPETTAKDGLIYTLARLHPIGHKHYRLLLTKVPQLPQTEGRQLRAGLLADTISAFGMRSKLKLFTGIAMLENQQTISPIPDVDDPQGSAIDAVILARYIWEAALRYPKGEQTLGPRVAEHDHSAHVIPPAGKNLSWTAERSITREEVYSWLKAQLNS
jgi:hypothetical protein